MKCSALFTAVTAVVVGLGLFASASADIIVAYNHDLLNPAFQTSSPHTSLISGATASVLNIAPGATGTNQINSLGWFQNNAGFNSLATALSNNQYFSLTVTPDSGNEITYESIDIVWSVQNNAANAGSEYTLLHDANTDGFDAGDSLGVIANTGDQPAGGNFFFPGNLNFDFADFTSAGAEEFRVYVHNIGSGAAVTRLGLGHQFSVDGVNDLAINGTITTSAVPEPTSFLFVGIGAVLGSLSLRRKK